MLPCFDEYLEWICCFAGAVRQEYPGFSERSVQDYWIRPAHPARPGTEPIWRIGGECYVTRHCDTFSSKYGLAKFGSENKL